METKDIRHKKIHKGKQIWTGFDLGLQENIC